MTNLPSPISSEPDPQLQAQLYRLLATLESVQGQIDQLDAEIQHSSAQIDALTRHLTDPAAASALTAALAELGNQQQTQQEHLAALDQNLTRLSRIQFKANALAETEQKQMTDAISILQGIVARRETIQSEQTWRDQRHLVHLREQARVELAVALLPVVDGLEAALGHGGKFLQDRRARAARRVLTPPPVAPPPPSLRQRLRLALGDELLPSPPPVIIENDAGVDDALAAWLRGLELVHERFLALLRSENIQPMPAEEHFDPHRHVAIAAAPAPGRLSGEIIEIIRPGYLHHDRVLRFAEVVVAAAADSTLPTP